MDPKPKSLHVYARQIDLQERTSLSVLSQRIHPGARVLDLGCGSGAVGHFLAERDGEQAGPIDGLTLSTDEAELAATSYRQVEVADLDHCKLAELFSDERYDFIICADVLEHTRHPDQVLNQCRGLLAEGGQVLISIPNVGYSGLVAELMSGEFRYRKEGLMDETHLRFFTRATLMRFLAENRWQVNQVEVIERELPDSEFNVAFDALPPAVSRYLLAVPDALTYQFLVSTSPVPVGQDPVIPDRPEQLPARAWFTSELYLGQAGQFAEAQKLTARGVIGEARQTLHFELPDKTPFDGLKLDPADRPGFIYLYRMQLADASGNTLWEWSPDQLDQLIATRHDGLQPQASWWPQGPAMLLLHDDDPWMLLPIPSPAVEEARGGSLLVELGWPMSADHVALASMAKQKIAKIKNEVQTLEQKLQDLHESLGDRQEQVDQLQQIQYGLEQQNRHLRENRGALTAQVGTLQQERDEARRVLKEIEESTVFRATRPIVHAKMRVDKLLGIGSARVQKQQTASATPSPMTPPAYRVDIVVPIYKGLEDTRRCVESVLAAACDTPWHLILINDASPEPELTQWLQEAARSNENITLLENAENLGFVGTVNRGMALSDEHDVLLLNSDTEVAPGWLDRIRGAAYSDQKVASVTPFSNNATICSYPRFCEDNELPYGWDTARLDALFARVNAGQVVDVPSGVGFCMYIRRDALRAVGLFDEEHFGKGYGEENDFCVRARQAGWRNLHVLDTFVRHYGGVSFGVAKGPRERAAMETLRKLHPSYERDVLRFLALDPARPARVAADLARALDGQRRLVLAVTHDRAGGTERHIKEVADLLSGQAGYLVLRPEPGQRLGLRLPGREEAMQLVFKLPEDAQDLVELLRRLGVCHVHYHHLLGHDKFARRLPASLGVEYDFTAHDYYMLCPQITLTDRSGSFCGECGDGACKLCLSYGDKPQGVGDLGSWRQKNAEFLDRARYVIAPSRDVLARLLRYVPGAPLRLVPHTDIDLDALKAVPAPRRLSQGQALKIVVVGALSAIKGADTLEQAAILAQRHSAPVEFHLLGYGYRALKTQPRARLTVHGAYEDRELPELLDWLQPDLVWFPARWPETYSYTLSACLAQGWPVAAPDLGAFVERLAGRPWSWVVPWDYSAAQWLDFFVQIAQDHFSTGKAPALPPFEGPANPLDMTQAFVRQASSWYLDEYLQGLQARPGEMPGRDTILEHLPEAEELASGLRGATLSSLAWLRSQPMLSGVARAIPPHWQTRVKSWLRK